MAFILEESRCLFARCLIQKAVFEDYKFVPPVPEGLPFDLQSQSGSFYSSQQGSQHGQHHGQRMPPGYEPDGTVSFGINLAVLLNCLNMFGTAGWSSFQNGDGNGGLIGGGTNSGPVTAIKLSYDGLGSRLNLTLEDNGIVTTCGVPTFDPEPPVDLDFTEENHSRIVMKYQAQWLEEGLRDLDSTSDRAVIRLSPEVPHLRISSLGTMENLDVNYSRGDVIETFDYHYDQPMEISYNFAHVLHVLKVCPVATKANITIDSKDFMKIQFLLPVVEHRYLFAEYSFSPLEME
ncbi:ssDNA endodeoxyribonuclease [Mortierella sp. NVP85]|nr:ssDNA endodeoxyribonuclease [Mortierella sp. NVP85]